MSSSVSHGRGAAGPALSRRAFLAGAAEIEIEAVDAIDYDGADGGWSP